ncbi:MAG: hypothetical protein RSD95_03805 [Clostridia bacterium]
MKFRLGSALINTMSSPYPVVGKCVITAFLVWIFLKEKGDQMTDISMMGTPDDFVLWMLMVLMPLGVLIGMTVAKRSYNDTLKKKGKTPAEMPYTADYAIGTIIGIAIGVTLALFIPGAAFGYLGIEGADLWIYIIVGIFAEMVCIWSMVRIVHVGIDVWIADVKKLLALAKDKIPEIKDEVKDTVDAIEGEKK